MSGPISVAVRHLIAAGVTGDALIDAVAEMEAAMAPAPPVLTARQARNKRYYEGAKERKASETRLKASEQDVSDSLPPCTPLAPSKKETPSGQRKKNPPASQGSRIPPDWRPDDHGIATAKAEGLTDNDVAREAAKFRDYWLAKPVRDGVKLDWPATWRNWVRRAAESLGRTPPARASPRDETYWRGVLAECQADPRKWHRSFEAECPKHLLAEYGRIQA